MIEIPTDDDRVNRTVEDFAGVLDCIEDSCFNPVPVKRLKEKVKGTKHTFAVRVCQNCDARFSCESYREYAGGSGRRGKVTGYSTDYVPEEEQEEFIQGNLWM